MRGPGRPKPFVDVDGSALAGSISEKIRVPVNGVEQGMFIKGRDEKNPILLFLHGGPGMPGYFLNDDYPTGLEHDFTVCWWEQRGAGLSYRADIPPESMTVEQFVADTIEVTKYLRRRFGRDRITLMGHSWGSFIGIQAAARAPELYHAYVGVAQVSHQIRSEELSYEYLLRRYREMGNAGMVGKLEAAPVTPNAPLPARYEAIRDRAMHTLGVGTTHDMKSVVWGIFVPSWRCRDYTLRERLRIWRGRAFSRGFGLQDQLLATDLTRTVTELELPGYFMHGIHDYTVSYPMAKEYLKQLKAPVKGFYTFELSAHSPVYEEPGRARKILRDDVLTGANALADTTNTRD